VAFAITVTHPTRGEIAVSEAVTIFEARREARRISFTRDCTVRHIRWSYATWDEFPAIEQWHSGKRCKRR
jgi:hypothetical protein